MAIEAETVTINEQYNEMVDAFTKICGGMRLLMEKRKGQKVFLLGPEDMNREIARLRSVLSDIQETYPRNFLTIGTPAFIEPNVKFKRLGADESII
jgi:hypothetical protein